MAHIKLINGKEWTPDTDIDALLKQWHSTPHPPSTTVYIPTPAQTHEAQTYPDKKRGKHDR